MCKFAKIKNNDHIFYVDFQVAMFILDWTLGACHLTRKELPWLVGKSFLVTSVCWTVFRPIRIICELFFNWNDMWRVNSAVICALASCCNGQVTNLVNQMTRTDYLQSMDLEKTQGSSAHRSFNKSMGTHPSREFVALTRAGCTRMWCTLFIFLWFRIYAAVCCWIWVIPDQTLGGQIGMPNCWCFGMITGHGVRNKVLEAGRPVVCSVVKFYSALANFQSPLRRLWMQQLLAISCFG